MADIVTTRPRDVTSPRGRRRFIYAPCTAEPAVGGARSPEVYAAPMTRLSARVRGDPAHHRHPWSRVRRGPFPAWSGSGRPGRGTAAPRTRGGPGVGPPPRPRGGG